MTHTSADIQESRHPEFIKNFYKRYLKVVIFVKKINLEEWNKFIWHNSPGEYIRNEALEKMPFNNRKYIVPFIYIAALDGHVENNFLAAKMHQIEISREAKNANLFYGELQRLECTLKDFLDPKLQNNYEERSKVGTLLRSMEVIFSLAARDFYECEFNSITTNPRSPSFFFFRIFKFLICKIELKNSKKYYFSKTKLE